MSAHEPSRPRPFVFDRIFDGDRVVEPVRPRRQFTPEELEAARRSAFAEGERSVVARAEEEMAEALSGLAAAAREGLELLARRVHEHKTASADLALAAGRAIAGAALDRCPEAPAAQALEALARELASTPRLVVRSACPDRERLKAALGEASARAGFTGQIVLQPGAGPASAAFELDWGEGSARFDPATAAAAVEAALARALAGEAAAEGIELERGEV